MPSVGEAAPDFTAETDSGEHVSLSSLRGKKVVLYFYPKDNTTGCTQEACDFRDRQALINEKNAVVVGVSTDNVQSHARFKQKFQLPFTLVADPDKTVAQKYGVYREKTLYGKKSLGTVRTTLLIDEQGRIKKVFDNVKVKGHVDQLLADL